MRLQEVYYHCKKALENWPEQPFEKRQQADGNSIYVIDDFSDFNYFLSNLEEVPSLSETIEKIRAINGGLKKKSDGATLNQGHYNVFSNLFNSLYLRVDNICDLCEAININTREAGFDIKLPPDLSLSELSLCAKDLDTVFNQCPFLTEAGDKISLSNVDTGSIWLGFATICTGAVLLLERLASLVNKVILIRSKMIVCKQQEEIAKKMGMENDILSTISETNKKILSSLTDNAIKELSETYKIQDNEDQERIRISINLLRNWMDRGMEIYASIDAPAEAKVAFPSQDQQKLEKDELKMLIETIAQE